LEGKLIPALQAQCASLQADGQAVITDLQNLSTQATAIQQGMEEQANGMNTCSMELTDQVNDFNHFNAMVGTIPDPTMLWSLFSNHLNSVISECNTLLNTPPPSILQMLNQGPKMTHADANAVCSNLIPVSSSENMCTDVA